jgi:hypothetical protein
VASVGRDVLRKIEKVANRSNRVIPDFIKKQVEQLIEMGAMEGGLDLNEFREIYDQEFGYPLEFRCYGFYSQEDFVFHGLAEVVELVLDGFCWKVVPVGFTSPDGSPGFQNILLEVRSSMRKILEENPFGMSITTLVRTHESCFGQLNLRQVLQSQTSEVALSTFAKGYEGYYGYLNLAELQCRDLVELCTSISDVCTLKLVQDGQYAIGQVSQEGRDGRARATQSLRVLQCTSREF